MSKKKFVLPGSKIVNATEIAEYPFKVRALAQELHITPGVTKNSLLSTSKFADANYITIFDKEAVNLYDANDTTITVTRGAILRGFKCPMTGMWRIPLVDLVRNNNTDTVIVNCHPLEFLPAHPPPPTRSTMCMNSRRSRSWCNIIMPRRDFQLNQRG